MGALATTKLSVEEYLALDRVAETPSEYLDGELFPLDAPSLNHGGVTVNLASLLHQRLAKTPCRVLASVRVRVGPTKFLLPDLAVVCGQPIVTDEHQDTLTNPKLIVEILSPSTTSHDYGEKFILYRRLESFEEYLLVSQDQPRIEVARKTPDKRWLLTTYEGLNTSVNIESLGFSLPMSEIYSNVDLETQEKSGF